MPTAVRFVKIRYGAVIDGIQIICSDFQGSLHGGTGGKEYTWNAFNGVSKIMICSGEFKGSQVVTGLRFCNGVGEWSEKMGKFTGQT